MIAVPPRVAYYAGKLTWSGVLLGVIAALLFNTYADIRLKGPLGIGVSFEGWKPKAQRYKAELEDVLEAQVAAAAAQRAVNDAAEQIYADVAERIDDEQVEARASALGAADRFIAANRVRCPPDRSAPSRADPAAADRGSGDGQGMREAAELDGAVAVPEADVRICTVNTLQAEAGQRWALELEAASANPPPAP